MDVFGACGVFVDFKARGCVQICDLDVEPHFADDIEHLNWTSLEHLLEHLILLNDLFEGVRRHARAPSVLPPQRSNGGVVATQLHHVLVPRQWVHRDLAQMCRHRGHFRFCKTTLCLFTKVFQVLVFLTGQLPRKCRCA